MESIYEQYRNDAAFYVVYIREAHPSDGWQVSSNKREGVVFEQPSTFESRTEIAEACQLGLDISIPMLVDDMTNTVEKAYSGWPDRLYVVSRDGTIGYKGGMGPQGFHPRDMERTLKSILEGQADE
ncbi:MAG: deiodinase [Spirochaetales bacterium]|nr:deiodinase [Spirochaetales bacterium]